MVFKESGQTEDDGCYGDADDVAVGSLDGAESLCMQRSTHGDVPINRQQNRQPGVDHTQHVGKGKQPAVEKAVKISVVDEVDEQRDVTQ